MPNMNPNIEVCNFIDVLSKIAANSSVENNQGYDITSVCFHESGRISLSFEDEELTAEENLAPGWRYLWKKE